MKHFKSIVSLASTMLLTSACVTVWDNPPELGMDQHHQFKNCPDRPNCVSSQAASNDDEHYLAPWSYEGDADKIMARLKAISEDVSEVEWLDVDGEDYLRGVFITSLMRYPDDIEFYYDSDLDLIHFRSASRFGYSDLGANRDRLLAIKDRFLQGED